nr:unnamed protein product [Callosobruchus analis]
MSAPVAPSSGCVVRDLIRWATACGAVLSALSFCIVITPLSTLSSK